MTEIIARQAIRRLFAVVAASVVLVAASTAIGVVWVLPRTVEAVAGNPGTPGTPTTLFTEDFENNGSTTVDPPVLITGYTGATGQTYAASPFWSSASACNGIVVAANSAPATAPPTLCAGYTSIWNALKILSGKLSNQFGKSGDRFTVASYTAGAGVAPNDYLQLETNSPIALPAGGAYLTVSIDSGAYNCNVGAPNYFMYLTDAGGTKHTVASGINPCLDPDAISDNSIDGRNALLVRTVGDAPQLIDSSSVKIEVENHNVSGAGNDATFDNIQLLDVSPQLDKTFESPVPYGSTSTITFTVTNTYSPSGDGSFTQLDPKVGWQFTDQLPAGLTIVGPPTTGAGSEACANFSGAGTSGTTVSATGDLSSGQAYCTVLVEVAASAPGSYTNAASDVTTVGLMPPIDASVTFTANPAISIVKSATANDINADAVANVGDTISYSFLVSNIGNVPLVNVAVSDPLAGAVTCPATSIPVGGSVTCNATTPHAITQGEVDSSQVPNTATVNGANSFDPASTVTSDSSVTTFLAPAPSLQFVKTAETPVDTNSSGLVDAGDTIQYTFSVTNSGNVTVTNVAVADNRAGAVTCSATTLAPGEITNCVAAAVYTITEVDETAGSVVNTASASGSTPAGGTVTSNTDSTTTPVSTPAPALAIVKTADAPVDVNSSGLTDAGDTIQYRFTVTNIGNVPVANVGVTDDQVGSVTCDATSLAPGESTACVAGSLYTVSEADETAGSVINVASATGVDPDGGPVTSPTDSTTTAVSTPAPSLVIDKSADPATDVNSSGITDAGDTIQYRFVVTNNGNVPIADVAVNDALAGSVTCAATTLAPASATNCVADSLYTVTPTDETNGSIVNVASATGLDPDAGTVTSNTDSTTSAVTTPDPTLVIDKSADAPVDVNTSGLTDAGDTIQYRFQVTNSGNVPITNVGVNDALAGLVTCGQTALVPGESTTCVADSAYVVTEADESNAEVVNTASAVGLDPDGGPAQSNTDSTTTAVDTPAPSLSFTKTAEAPTDVNASTLTDAGDTIRYTFTVTNTGNVPISGVVITDDLVGSVTCVDTDLMVGGTTDCVADALYVVTVGDQTAGAVDNTASASGLDPDGGTVTSNTDSTSTPVDTPAPSLALTKSASAPVDVNSSTLTDAGDTIQYTFTVTNTGNVPLSSVRIDDPKAGTVTCDASTLDVGLTTNCAADAAYVVTVADETAGAADNTATAFGLSPDNDSIPSNSDSTSTPVDTPAPALAIVKTADEPVDVNSSGLTDAGDTIQYRFVVTNTGNVPIGSVGVTDDRVGSVTCAATALAVGASTDCVAESLYVVTEADEAAGSIENIASAQGVDPDGDDVTSPTDNTITGVVAPQPSLSIVKTADSPVDVNSSGLTDAGDTIQYRFVVTNTGNVPLSGVAVSDDLAGTVTCGVTTLAVGDSTDCVAEATYMVTEDDEGAGSVVNVATALAIDPDGGDVTSAPDSTTTAVATPAPSLVLDKIADEPIDVNSSGLVDAGDTIQYRFVVTNNGNVPIVNVAVSDDLAGSVTCDLNVLAVGESTDCVADAVYTVTEADETAGAVVNTATAGGSDPDGGAVTSQPDSTETIVMTPNPSLVLDKIADEPIDVNSSGLVDAGDTIQYRFVVTNNGNVPIGGIAVVDELAGPVTCAEKTLAVGQTTECVADSTYTVTQADETSGEVVNVAVAEGLDPDQITVSSNTDSTTSPVAVPAPSLELAKSADSPVDVNTSGLTDAGDTIQYRFVVSNSGNVPISGVEVADPLAGSVTCEQTVLAVGESTNCLADAVYTITEADESAGAVNNTATATGVDPDGEDVTSEPDSTTTPVSVPGPSILFEKLAAPAVDANSSGIVDAGDTIQYSFVVTNNGDVPLSQVAVTDDLVGSVTCAATALAVGQSVDCIADAVYTITEPDQTAGVVDNTASAAGLDPDGEAVVSNTDSTSTPVEVPDPSVALVKQAIDSFGAVSVGPFQEEDPVLFRFGVTNTGNVNLSNVGIEDPMISDIVCDDTTLAPGATTVCTSEIPHDVTAEDVAAGSFVNTASVYAVTAVETTSHSASASVTVEPKPEIKRPVTGSNIGLLIGASLALLGAGTALVLTARRSRSRRSYQGG